MSKYREMHKNILKNKVEYILNLFIYMNEYIEKSGGYLLASNYL
jgi:hypothetical protein